MKKLEVLKLILRNILKCTPDFPVFLINAKLKTIIKPEKL